MARGGVRRDYDSAQRKKRIALIAGVAVFVLIWIGVVVWLGRMDSAASPDQASSDVPVETTEQAPAQTTDDPPEGEQEGSSSDDGSQGSATQEAGQGNKTPSVQEGSVPQGAFDQPEEGGQQQDSAGDSESGSEQSGSEQSEVPSEKEIDMTRARTASERYIVAAYGYTGSDEDEYLSAIEDAASKEIYDSPGGTKLQDYAKAAPECGMKSTAILEEFEVIGQGEEGLDAVVTFSVEDADGQTHTFRQEQRLSSSDGLYKVSGVSVEELISDTTPRESCPGSGAEQQDEGESSAGDQTVSDERQVRSAAGRFVAAAYGYTGDSTQDYRAGVEKVAITEELLESPGGERINDYSEIAGEDGIKAAAKMEHFEITGQSGEEVEGMAYFDVGRSYDRYGGIKGETTPYSQELTLKPYEGSYRVSSASAEQEVEGNSTEGGSTEGGSTGDGSSGEGKGRKLTK